VDICKPLLALSRRTPVPAVPEAQYLKFVCLVILLVRKLSAGHRPFSQCQDAAGAFYASFDTWSTSLAVNAEIRDEWAHEVGDGNWESNLRLRGDGDVKRVAERLAEIIDKHTSI